MKLQMAIDFQNTQEALEMVEKVHDIIDIVEIGTPRIVVEGLVPVHAIKEKYPHVTVLADTKIVDGGDVECEDACDAGADIVTVLAVADDATVSAVVKAAHERGKKAMADLISVHDIKKRAGELIALGVDYVCVHTALDVQQQGRTPLGDLRELVCAIPCEKSAVAGGVSLKTIDEYKALNPAIVIVGGGITKADDVRAAVKSFNEKIAD